MEDEDGYITEISELEPYGTHGWSWTQHVAHEDDPEAVVTTLCRTDENGKGLWVWSEFDGCWQQAYGTLQYRLTARTPEHALAQIQSPARRHN